MVFMLNNYHKEYLQNNSEISLMCKWNLLLSFKYTNQVITHENQLAKYTFLLDILNMSSWFFKNSIFLWKYICCWHIL